VHGLRPGRVIIEYDDFGFAHVYSLARISGSQVITVQNGD